MINLALEFQAIYGLGSLGCKESENSNLKRGQGACILVAFIYLYKVHV